MERRSPMVYMCWKTATNSSLAVLQSRCRVPNRAILPSQQSDQLWAVQENSPGSMEWPECRPQPIPQRVSMKLRLTLNTGFHSRRHAGLGRLQLKADHQVPGMAPKPSGCRLQSHASGGDHVHVMEIPPLVRAICAYFMMEFVRLCQI